MIRFNHVSHGGFGRDMGLNDLSFHITSGEAGAIVGPVGSGHDLIMSMCSLELGPNEGKVLIDGIDTRVLGTRQRQRLRRTIGSVSTDFPLLRDRSVLENVILPLEIRGWSRRRAVRRALKALESAGVLELKGIWPPALRSEDRPMVCLARAIAPGPRLMLVHGIREGLPAEKSIRLMAVLRDMAAQGTAVVLLEHSVNLLDLSGWRAHFLNAGTIERVETVPMANHTDRNGSLVDRLLNSTNSHGVSQAST